MQKVEKFPAACLASALREGLFHHAARHLSKAAACYRRAYEENPDNADALLLLGIVARETRQFSAAIRLISLAAQYKPHAAQMHLNLALAYLGAGDTEQAAASCQRVLALDPLCEQAWCCMARIETARGNNKSAHLAWEHAMNLPSSTGHAALEFGNLCCRQQRYADALAMYVRGLRSAPSNADLHFAFGSASCIVGNMVEAKAAYEKALQLRPDFPEVHLNLGNALYDEGNFPGAEASYRQAIALRPQYAKAHCNLGNTLSILGRHAEAKVCYERVIALKLDALVTARHQFGNTLMRRRDYRRAEACFRRLLQLEPHRAEHHSSLGTALAQQRRALEAEQNYRKALQLDPDYSAAHTNLANALLMMGKTEEMKYHYRRSVELDPGSPGGQYNLALSCLREGNFREGFQRYEWRWDFSELKLPRRRFTQPQWQGQPLNGKTILVHAEQGHGDTLQFVRYLPRVAARGGRVILEVQPRLGSLLQTMQGVDQSIIRGHALPEFSCHCPLMSLPLLFDTTIDTIPSATPYLSVDPALVAAAWQAHPRQKEKLRVGLAWAGNPQYKSDHQRSTTLQTLLPLAEVRDVAFFSLQFGPAAEQIAPLQSRFPLTDACSRNRDFTETAALVATLDLVISVDTAVVHLAGALGIPVWVLLPYLADWRWLEGRDDSPWYPTARLFRQPTLGDWKSLANHVRDALRQYTGIPPEHDALKP